MSNRTRNDATVKLRDFDLYNPTETHKMLRDSIREFVRGEVEPQAEEFDRKEVFNQDLFKKTAALGLLGITVPEEFGGSAMDALAVVIAHEELSISDPGFALAYLAHSLLCVNNLAVNGNPEQKKKYLPKLCTGDLIGAMAISEPSVGTDAMAMKTTATKSGNNYILNGRKMWITNGAVDDKGTPGDVIWVYAKTGESKNNAKAAISTFIVEKGFKGFSVGQKINGKLGMRSSNTAELVFDNCEIPEANRVGQEGDSASHMMRNLEIERIGLAAMSTGIALRALDVMVRYSNERTAFGKNLHHFGQIQAYIAESYAETQAARAYLYDTARKIDLDHKGHRLNSDGVKLFASPVGKRVADRAIQVLGGYGYVAEYVVERLWRDAKLLEIGGGTIEAHHKNIAADLVKNPGVILG